MNFINIINNTNVPFQNISSFKDIDIHAKTLVMCDIDETLLTFHPFDWNKLYNLNLIKCKSPELAVTLTNEEWVDVTFNGTPKMTDREGFMDMMKRIRGSNSLIVFVTARHVNYKQLAYKHFKDIEMDIYKYLIHFCGPNSKGDYILNNINLKKYNRLVFVDDLMSNIVDVKTKIPRCVCYCFKYTPKD